MSTKPAYLVVDCETEGLRWYADRLHGFALCWPDGTSFYFPGDAVPDVVRALLADPTLPKVGHRLRFDWKFLRAAGYEVAGAFHCTKVMAHLLDENSPTGLKALSERYFGAEVLANKDELDAACEAVGAKHVGELVQLDLALPDRPFTALIGRYCVEDVRNTNKLFQLLGAKLKESDEKVKRITGSPKGPLDYYRDEAMPAERALLELEYPGIRIDTDRVKAYGEQLEGERAAILLDLGALASAPVQAAEARSRADLRTEYAVKCAAAKEKALLKGLLAVSKAKTPKEAAARAARSAENAANQGPKYDALYSEAAAKLPPFNWSSPEQVGELLEALGYSLPRTKTGKPKTDEATLQSLLRQAGRGEPRVLNRLLELRAVEKLIGTYVEGLLERTYNGRIYSEYPVFTVTGRSSSENPNMQNIPRGSPIKAAFRPDTEDHVFIYGDYSQVELRIAAHLSQDPVMLEWFRDGIDPHKQAAETIFGELTADGRQTAKRVNFLTIYDGKDRRLEETLRQEGLRKPDGSAYEVQDCRAILDAWWIDHAPYRAHLDAILATLKSRGALVAESGRVRRIPEIAYGAGLDWRKRMFTGTAEQVADLYSYEGEKLNSKELFERASKRFSHAKKQGFNFPVQNVGASITKAALVTLLARRFTGRTTVHDSIVVQVLRSEALERAEQVRKIMESAYTLSVPLKVDIKLLNSLSESDVFLPAQPTPLCGAK